MYKITKSQDQYKLFRHDGTKYTLLGKFKHYEILANYYEEFVIDSFLQDPTVNKMHELYEALKSITANNHNMAEIGAKGCFIYSVYEQCEEDLWC